jgi:hypothetical protein
VRRGVVAALGALLWLGLIVVIALGAAGIVTGVDHAPGTPARADLTDTADAQVAPMLDAALTDLEGLADQVDALGIQARGALAALNGVDTATVDRAIADGDTLVTDIGARTSAIRAELAAVPYVGTPTEALFISPAVAARHADLVAALDATEGLDVAWKRLTLGSVAASRMSGYLAEHDRLVGLAATRGRQARYRDALTFIAKAEGQLTAARALRDQLANTVDVTVLDEWIKRNEDYDVALKGLYTAISTVGGKVTTAVRDAIAAEKAAKARLPPDTRGLVIIMAEIGRGGMNGAVIAIEETRGKLASAIEALAPASPAPGDSGAPPENPTPTEVGTPTATAAP